MDEDTKLDIFEKYPFLKIPHWALASIEAKPGSLPLCWELHRTRFASKIPRLEKHAITKITEWLQGGGLAKEVARLIAENLPCQYLDFIDDPAYRP